MKTRTEKKYMLMAYGKYLSTGASYRIVGKVNTIREIYSWIQRHLTKDGVRMTFVVVVYRHKQGLDGEPLVKRMRVGRYDNGRGYIIGGMQNALF